MRIESNMAQLAVALELAWMTEKYANAPLGVVMRRLVPPSTFGQLCFAAREGHHAVGFATVGKFPQEQHDRLLADPDYVPPIDTWRVGDRFWIMDVVAVQPGVARGLMMVLKEAYQGQTDRVFAYRDTDNGPRLVSVRVPGRKPSEEMMRWGCPVVAVGPQ